MITGLFTVALLCALAAVVVSDAVRYTIPNWLNGAILALYLVAICFLPAEPLWALFAASIIFAVGLVSFSFGFMGGGDVKLLFVLMLWTGWSEASIEFVFMTALIGGVLVIGVILLRNIVPFAFKKQFNEGRFPRLLRDKEPVPYGLAIAGAFLVVLLNGHVEMLTHGV